MVVILLTLMLVGGITASYLRSKMKSKTKYRLRQHRRLIGDSTLEDEDDDIMSDDEEY